MKYPTHESTINEQIARLQQARQNLGEARGVEQAKVVRQQAESIRTFAQKNGLGLEVQNFAAELKLQAERVGGHFLAHMKLRGGDRNQPAGRRRSLRLKDLGVDKNQSARWQMEASVPEPSFRQFVQTEHASGREISSAALLRLARRLREGGADELLTSSNSVPPYTVATTSHLMTADCEQWSLGGTEYDEMQDLVMETRNHYDLLTGLIRSAFETSVLRCDSTDFRAITRYLAEVEKGLDQLARTVVRLSRSQPYDVAQLNRASSVYGVRTHRFHVLQ